MAEIEKRKKQKEYSFAQIKHLQILARCQNSTVEQRTDGGMIMGMENKGDLLELISRELHYTYSSDLRFKEIDSGKLRQVIQKIPKGYCSRKMWNEAIEYITHQEVSFTNEEDAVSYLSNYRPGSREG